MTVVIVLLAATVILLCTPQEQRPKVLGKLIILGAAIAIWIGLKIPEFLGGLLAVVFASVWGKPAVFYATGVMWLGGAFFVFLGSYLFYLFVQDQLENRSIRREWKESGGKIRTKFDARVKTYIGNYGWDRERAETTTMRIANPKKL